MSWQCPSCSAVHPDASAGYPATATTERKQWCEECAGFDVDRDCGRSHSLPCGMDSQCPQSGGPEPLAFVYDPENGEQVAQVWSQEIYRAMEARYFDVEQNPAYSER